MLLLQGEVCRSHSFLDYCIQLLIYLSSSTDDYGEISIANWSQHSLGSVVPSGLVSATPSKVGNRFLVVTAGGSVLAVLASRNERNQQVRIFEDVLPGRVFYAGMVGRWVDMILIARLEPPPGLLQNLLQRVSSPDNISRFVQWLFN